MPKRIVNYRVTPKTLSRKQKQAQESDIVFFNLGKKALIFGAHLHRLMIEINMSLDTLSALTGISESKLAGLLDGRYRSFMSMTLDELGQLGLHLGEDVGYFSVFLFPKEVELPEKQKET